MSAYCLVRLVFDAFFAWVQKLHTVLVNLLNYLFFFFTLKMCTLNLTRDVQLHFLSDLMVLW